MNPGQTLTFTSVNGLMPQTVTVTGVDDTVVDGDVMYVVLTDPATSFDSAYDGLDPSDVSVTNTDDDVTQPSAVGLSAISLFYSAGEGESDPADQTLTIANGGDPSMDWSVMVDQSWVTLGPTSGNLTGGATQDVTVSVDITSLTAGFHVAQITVGSTTAVNAPQTVSVTLILTEVGRYC